MKNKAFTLIELLVVVLIIGILAAIAVPQYQKAVVKSKYGTLKILTRSLYEAEKVYFLQNGTWATDFTKLDLSVAGSLVGGTFARNTIYFDGNKACALEANYIYCYDYHGIGMAYLIDFAEGKHYCIGSSTGITAEICKNETGYPTDGGSNGAGWYPYQ